MKPSSDIRQPRLVLFATGSVSIALAVWHFATRGDLVADAVTGALHDLNGLSMLFAGVVTVAVAWMAVSRQLVAGYAALYGVYFATNALILFFARISWIQASIAAGLAVASLFAASNAWAARHPEKTPG
ncbi:MAG: hypothetical protein IH849_02650 [Acidobacteria bacterium]|nr:hypothetical protein [Acidobacteriota bacterium]